MSEMYVLVSKYATDILTADPVVHAGEGLFTLEVYAILYGMQALEALGI